MTEFKIQLEDSLVQTFGAKKIEEYLQKIIAKIELKMATQDVLEDLENIDLNNDERWKIAREKAWAEQRHKYIKPW